MEQRARQRIAELRNDHDYQEQKKHEFVEHNRNTFGVCSLCASYDNLLLWAHYSYNHTGFCVGLSVDSLHNISVSLAHNNELLDLHRVRYRSRLLNPNFFKSMISLEDTRHVQAFIETKSRDWKYEQEWRLVFWHHVNEAMPLGHVAIREVILGCRISSIDRDRILDLCREHVPHARVLQAGKSETRFSLDFTSVEL